MTQPSLLDLPSPEPTPNPVKAERQRLIASARRVLTYLQRHGSALNWELTTPELGGIGASRRVWECVQEGWDIRKEHVSGGTWRWTFHGLKK